MRHFVTRHYTYRGHGGDFGYTSDYRLGSLANYADFKNVYDRRFGRYNTRPTWDMYKHWVRFSSIVRETL